MTTMMSKILLLAVSSVAFAQVPGKFTTVDATQGYTVAGAAQSNHVLCGNGSRYVDAASCGTNWSNPLTFGVSSNASTSTITVSGVAGSGSLTLGAAANFT